MIVNKRFNQYCNNYENFDSILKIPRSIKKCNQEIPLSIKKINKEIPEIPDYLKKLSKKKKDSRYAFKNQRITNKDWKDFNNSQNL